MTLQDTQAEVTDWNEKSKDIKIAREAGGHCRQTRGEAAGGGAAEVESVPLKWQGEGQGSAPLLGAFSQVLLLSQESETVSPTREEGWFNGDLLCDLHSATSWTEQPPGNRWRWKPHPALPIKTGHLLLLWSLSQTLRGSQPSSLQGRSEHARQFLFHKRPLNSPAGCGARGPAGKVHWS